MPTGRAILLTLVLTPVTSMVAGAVFQGLVFSTLVVGETNPAGPGESLDMLRLAPPLATGLAGGAWALGLCRLVMGRAAWVAVASWSSVALLIVALLLSLMLAVPLGDPILISARVPGCIFGYFAVAFLTDGAAPVTKGWRLLGLMAAIAVWLAAGGPVPTPMGPMRPDAGKSFHGDRVSRQDQAVAISLPCAGRAGRLPAVPYGRSNVGPG